MRFPFLDRPLVEFTGTLPPELKVRGLEKRYLFKRAFRGLLPREILAKQKHGFGVPTSDWLRSHRGIRELARDVLLANRAAERGYFRRGVLERLFEQLVADSTPFYGDILWTLLMLELWHRRHVDGRGARRMSALTSSLLRWTATGLHAARLSGPLSRALGYASAAPTFPILSYHRVNDEGDPFFPSLSTEVFERQMAFVARAYVVLTVEELVERMRRRAVPRNALAITFDDGYRDNLTHAAPILARLGLPATVFLVTGAIATGEPLWFDRLAAAFKQAVTPAWRAPWGESLPLETPAQRLAALGQTLGPLQAPRQRGAAPERRAGPARRWGPATSGRSRASC